MPAGSAQRVPTRPQSHRRRLPIRSSSLAAAADTEGGTVPVPVPVATALALALADTAVALVVDVPGGVIEREFALDLTADPLCRAGRMFDVTHICTAREQHVVVPINAQHSRGRLSASRSVTVRCVAGQQSAWSARSRMSVGRGE